MKFEVEKTQIDFGTISIDNIFIEDYMPIANGSFVKVYLYAYKNMKNNPEFEIDNEKLARNLKLTIKDVENAWDYWDKEDVVDKVSELDGSYSILFKDLKKLYVENGYSSNLPKKKPTSHETLLSAMDHNSTREMFTNIDYYMRRQTTPTEKLEIINWITDYNMAPEIIDLAFEYAVEKKKKVSVNYVKAVVISWYDSGITSIEGAEAEIVKTDSKYIRKNKILRKLGLQNRSVSEPEIRLINAWYDDYRFDEEVINEAISRTSKISRPSINYVNSILLKWRDLGIESLDDISKKDIKPKTGPKAKKTNFHNFKGQSENLSDKELNEIAQRLTRRRSE